MAHMSCTPWYTHTLVPQMCFTRPIVIVKMAHKDVQDSTGMVLYLLIESFAQFYFPDC